MPKRIRRNYPINIAPKIIGLYDNNSVPRAFDEKNRIDLNPNETDDKIYIYERQVNGWFLERATRLVSSNNNGFIVLMVCLSYLEGVEQYITGQTSNRRSSEFFRNSMHRIYPERFSDEELNSFYSEARCGLFHNGMVSGKILISLEYETSVSIPDNETIQINQKKFLIDLKKDFKDYISLLRDKSNIELRENFNRMFSNI